MQDRVGEEFAALVLNPAKYGLFVELTDLFVEGLVPIDSLRDDRYTWRENTHEIVGERRGRRLPRRRPRAASSSTASSPRSAGCNSHLSKKESHSPASARPGRHQNQRSASPT